MYTRLARAYAARGVPSIFVRYRTPGVLEESVPDALAAIEFLKEQGVRRIALSGWSFGGAVIVNTAVRAPEVVTVVGYAPQALDTEPVAGFTGQSLLLIHSDNDENVPFESSQEILDEAPAHLHKEFVPITSGADHLLDGEGDNLSPRVKAWIDAELNPPPYCDE
jgi:dienelactone hydrolase